MDVELRLLRLLRPHVLRLLTLGCNFENIHKHILVRLVTAITLSMICDINLPFQEAEALLAQETLAPRGQERSHREEADEKGVGHGDERPQRGPVQNPNVRASLAEPGHKPRSISSIFG